MSEPASRIPISDNHRRAIGVTVALLDQMLCEFEDWLARPGIRSVGYEREKDVPAAVRRALEEEFAAVRKILEQMKRTLGLQPRKERVATMIWSRSASFWETLIETDSQHLRAYGPVPTKLAQYLDPRIQELCEHVRRIGDLARGGLKAVDGAVGGKESADEGAGGEGR